MFATNGDLDILDNGLVTLSPRTLGQATRKKDSSEVFAPNLYRKRASEPEKNKSSKSNLSILQKATPKIPVKVTQGQINVTPIKLRDKDQRLISQAGVYLNPNENCPVSKNLETIKICNSSALPRRTIRLAQNLQQKLNPTGVKMESSSLKASVVVKVPDFNAI